MAKAQDLPQEHKEAIARALRQLIGSDGRPVAEIAVAAGLSRMAIEHWITTRYTPSLGGLWQVEQALGLPFGSVISRAKKIQKNST